MDLLKDQSVFNSFGVFQFKINDSKKEYWRVYSLFLLFEGNMISMRGIVGTYDFYVTIGMDVVVHS